MHKIRNEGTFIFFTFKGACYHAMAYWHPSEYATVFKPNKILNLYINETTASTPTIFCTTITRLQLIQYGGWPPF